MLKGTAISLVLNASSAIPEPLHKFGFSYLRTFQLIIGDKSKSIFVNKKIKIVIEN